MKNGSSEFSVVFSKEQNNPQQVGNEMVSTVVARVSEDIRECIKAVNDRIFIGFSACKVFDRFYVKSCAACHRFGHYHAECESAPCCGYCGAADHTSQQCQIHQQKKQDKYKCVTLFVEIFARTNFRASALRENWKFSRVLIFAHLYIFEF